MLVGGFYSILDIILPKLHCFCAPRISVTHFNVAGVPLDASAGQLAD